MPARMVAAAMVRASTSSTATWRQSSLVSASLDWSVSPTVTVVVVDSPVGRAEPWVHDVLAALEPSAAIGVTDAGRKTEDIAAWADTIGGLDAIAVNNTDDTVSPASILQVGIPVAIVDREPATPELWAELLIERLRDSSPA